MVMLSLERYSVVDVWCWKGGKGGERVSSLVCEVVVFIVREGKVKYVLLLNKKVLS